jgi:uncharacterized tellurite resistance protein B-like protein
MEQDKRQIAFIKALITAAWADGELSGGEIRKLSYYLQLLDIRGPAYDELKEMLEHAMTPDEAIQVLEEQLQVLGTPAEQRTLLAAVEDLLVADEQLSEEEQGFLRKLKELTSNAVTPASFVDQLRRMWSIAPVPPGGGSEQRGEDAGDSAGDRPTERFFQRRLLEYFRGRIAVARARAGLPIEAAVTDRDLYRSIIWAGLLARVAHADKDLCPAEEQRLRDILATTAELPEPEVNALVETFCDEHVVDIDLRLLVAELGRLSGSETSESLLDSLFLVAGADGKLEDAELKVIQEIALGAGFSAEAFHSSLDRCRQRITSGWN